MTARTKCLPVLAALVAILGSACSDNLTSPVLSSSRASLSGGTSGGGGGGGGGSTAVIPQVAGAWNGHEVYDSTLAVFFLSPDFMTIPASITLAEDAAGNVTGLDNIMHQAITGKAATNGTISLQDGSYYGTRKMVMTITGSVACSDGSTGVVMSGKFQAKEGFGVITVDNCPII